MKISFMWNLLFLCCGLVICQLEARPNTTSIENQDISLEVTKCSMRDIIGRIGSGANDVTQLFSLFYKLLTNIFSGKLGIDMLGIIADIYTASKNIVGLVNQIWGIIIKCIF